MGRNLGHVCRSMGGGAVVLPLIRPPEDMSSSWGLEERSACCHLCPLSVVLHLRGGSSGRGPARRAAPGPTNQLRRHPPPSITLEAAAPEELTSCVSAAHDGDVKRDAPSEEGGSGFGYQPVMSSGFTLQSDHHLLVLDPGLAPSQHAGPA